MNVYLGQRISLDRNNSLELNRRIHADWASFNCFRKLLANQRIRFHIKKLICSSCVELAILYGSEIWTLHRRNLSKLVVARQMMRKMLETSLLKCRTKGGYYGRQSFPTSEGAGSKGSGDGLKRLPVLIISIDENCPPMASTESKKTD